MWADHNHTPVTIPCLLLQKAAGFGIKPQQKAWIRGHLRLQHNRWQVRPLRRRRKEPIKAVFTLLEHWRRKGVTARISRQIIKPAQDQIWIAMEQIIEELVARQETGVKVPEAVWWVPVAMGGYSSPS